MVINDLPILNINKLTKEQYDRELAAGNINEDELYLVPETVKDPIPAPEQAKVGQTIVVSKTDENGKPTQWGTTTLRGKIVTILDHTFESDVDAESDWGFEDALVGGRHFWQHDIDGTPLSLVRGWVIINWGTGSKSACTLQPAPTFANIGGLPQTWASGDPGAYSIDRGSIGNSIISDETPVLYGVADLSLLWSISGTSAEEAWKTYNTNHLPAQNIWASKDFPCFDTFKFFMRGTIKAGTRIRVFGETGQVR